MSLNIRLIRDIRVRKSLSCFAFLSQSDPALASGLAALLDKLLEVGGLGIIVFNICFCQIAPVGLSGGDEHSDMQPGAGACTPTAFLRKE